MYTSLRANLCNNKCNQYIMGCLYYSFFEVSVHATRAAINHPQQFRLKPICFVIWVPRSKDRGNYPRRKRSCPVLQLGDYNGKIRLALAKISSGCDTVMHRIACGNSNFKGQDYCTFLRGEQYKTQNLASTADV